MADNDHQPPPSLLPETYTVKEVIADLKVDLVDHLNKQDGVLSEIRTAVDSKADKADLVQLATEVRVGFDDHGKRITTLEQHRLDVDANRKFHNRVWAVIAAVASVSAIIAGAFIAALVH